MASLVTTTVTGTITVSSNGSFGGANETSAKLFVRGGNADFWNSTNSLLRINHDGTRANLQSFTGGAYDDLALNPDGGSVGIGTNNPDSLLMVYKSGADSIIHVRGASSGGDARVRINGYNSSELYLDRNGVGRFAFRRTTGTDDLSLLKLNDNYTDNSTIMFWDYSSGSVGIGTDAPVNALHVHGSADGFGYIRITDGGLGATATDGARIGYNSSALRIQNYENSNISFFTNNTTEALTIQNDGNIGIGTATPGTIFHIHTDSASAQEIFFDNDGVGPVGITFRTDFATDAGLANFIRFDAADDGGNNTRYSTIESFIVDNTNGTEDGALRFSVMAGGNDTESMTISARSGVSDIGWVGVGTNAPTFPFQVYGTSQTNGAAKRIAAFFDTTSAAAGTGAGIALGGYTNGTASAINDFGVIQAIKENGTAGNYASAMLFLTRANGANPTEQMRINSDGNVGIGTNNPAYPLQVYYAGGVGIGLQVKGTANRSKLAVSDNDTTAYVIAEDSMASFGRSDALSTSNLNINSSGSVGIGETNPDKPLHIKGTNTAGIVIENTTNATNMDIDWYNNVGSVAGRIRYSEGTGDFTFMPNQSTAAVMFKYDGDVEVLDGQVQVISGAVSAPSFSFTNDTDTGMSRPTTNALNFITNGTEQVRINADGSVGIGTNAPDTLVHMRGSGATLTLESTGNTDDPTIMLQRDNNTGLAARIQLDNSGGDVFFDNTYDNDNGDIYFRTKGTTKRVTIKGSGVVGIGTDDPGAALDVAKSSGNILRCKGDSFNTRFAVGASGACTIEANTGSYALDITNADSGKKGIRLADSVKTVWGSGDDLQIHHDGSNSYIQNVGAGNLYITNDNGGTINLQTNSSKNAVKCIEDAAVELYYNSSKKFETLNTGAKVTGTLQADVLNNAANSANIIYRSGSSTIVGNNANALVVLDGGSVGIGTDGPETKLHVEGSNFTDSSIKLERTGSGVNEDAGLTFSKSATATDGHRLGGVYFGHSGTNYALIRAEMDASTGGEVYIVAADQTNAISNTSVKTLQITAAETTINGTFKPRLDSTYTLGTTANRWSHLYIDEMTAADLTINTVGVRITGGTDIDPSSGGAGQFRVTGNGYTTFLAMNGTAAYFGHNSSARSLVLMTNETARLTITGGGAATFSSSVAASSFSGNGASLTSLNASNLSSGTVPAARLGNVTIASSATDILSASSGSISADDAGADKIVFWDDSASKLTYLTVGSNLSISGTTISASGGGGGGGMTSWIAEDGDGTEVTISDGKYLKFKESTGIDVNLTDTSSGTSADPYDMTIKVNSSVCMGINGPSASASPNGNFFTFAEGTAMQLAFSGSQITFSAGTSSDYRLKKNISTFNSDAWVKVKSVNLRKFDFDEDAVKVAIDSPDKEIDREPQDGYTDNIGFIAHELAEAGIKGSVIGDKDGVDGDGNFIYQKVNYISLVPVLWGALNEAISKIETLESKVQALEDK